MKLWRHIKRVIQMKPDRSHRVSKPDALGYRTNSPVAVALEDERFVEFLAYTRLTANYLVATSNRQLDDRKKAIELLMAYAYLSGRGKK